MADQNRKQSGGKPEQPGRNVTDIGGPSKSTSEEVNIGNASNSPMERGPGQVSRPDKPIEENQPSGGIQGDDEAGGITNRPLEEEQQNQERLPPRGQSKNTGS